MWTLTLCFHHLNAVDTDKLTDTVHYGTAYSIVKDVDNSAADLTERLAGEIVHAFPAEFPLIDAIDEAVSKPEAPVDGNLEAMRAYFPRQETGNGSRRCISYER